MSLQLNASGSDARVRTADVIKVCDPTSEAVRATASVPNSPNDSSIPDILEGHDLTLHSDVLKPGAYVVVSLDLVNSLAAIPDPEVAFAAHQATPGKYVGVVQSVCCPARS